jgi:hypothetical protein
VPTSLAHRGRRINLNFPLPSETTTPTGAPAGYVPPAYDPIEPVRQKWIRDTYQFMKAVLPPKAVDTPEELAQLSQFVVNIVDFRDPDGTITKFVNTDVATSTTTAPGGRAAAPAGQRSVQLDFATVPPTTPYDPSLTEADGYLVQYGMEYPPVAINEVLAYSFQFQGGTGTPPSIGRFFLELVNTLTADNGDNSGAPGQASDLTLDGWDLVVTEEDNTNDGLARPDPYTGQVPFTGAVPPRRAPLGIPGTGMVDTNGNSWPIPALREAGNVADLSPPPAPPGDINPSHHVLGYPQPTSGDPETPPPPPAPNRLKAEVILRNPTNPSSPGSVTDLLPVPAPMTGTANGRYYWVYLRRPLYPTKAYQPDPTQADYNPMVVVDSMRFPYIRANGTPPATPGTQHIWSVQRFQPFQGGQGVPNPKVGGPVGTLQPLAYGRDRETDSAKPGYNTVDPTWAAYGYTEQTFYSNDGPNDPRGLYNPADTTSTVTLNIRQTINAPNGPPIISTQPTWDPLPFHDRDFQSVAELLLVPACPPGLFTKQFVAHATAQNENIPIPPHDSGTFPNKPIDLTPPSGAEAGDRLPGNVPHTYPYLADKFFYSPDGQDTRDNPGSGNPPLVGGPTGMGWHKMLEFFEVPAPSLGAIGPADGENRDWYREDLRPGQVNLNLIIDEAVFFGLIDDPRLNRDTTQTYSVPRIVTQVDNTGIPTAWYAMGNTGYYDGTAPVMKPAFADFLKLRHANPNAIYASGAILPTQSVFNTLPGLPREAYLFGAQPEAPFHSLSYPDIRYTVLRPADPQRPAQGGAAAREFDNGLDSFRDFSLEAPPYRLRPPRIPRLRLFQVPDASTELDNNRQERSELPNPAGMMIHGKSPGGTFPLLYAALSPLTSVDWPTGSGNFGRPILAHPGLHPIVIHPDLTDPVYEYDNPPTPPGMNNRKSPTGTNLLLGGATETGSGAQATATVSGGAVQSVTMTNNGQYYTSPPEVLFVGGGGSGATATARVDTATGQITAVNVTNGGSGYTSAPTVLFLNARDAREHPVFRIEWLQKILNNTTVRTHQYAVWVTVGYFEVVQQGDPRLAQTNPLLAIDKLGPEIGAAEGRAVRHRAFFLLDRTRAIGFNPRDPGDFRDLVVHRRRIE